LRGAWRLKGPKRKGEKRGELWERGMRCQVKNSKGKKLLKRKGGREDTWKSPGKTCEEKGKKREKKKKTHMTRKKKKGVKGLCSSKVAKEKKKKKRSKRKSIFKDKKINCRG